MKRTLLLCSLLCLAACAPLSRELQSRLHNPLFAEQYSEELVDTLSNLFILSDPVLEDAAVKAEVTAALEHWRTVSEEAQKKQKAGVQGLFAAVTVDTLGRVLLTEDGLYFSPDFLTTPGADLHVYLSSVLDPRTAEFPDASAKDIGSLQSPYGDQAYEISALPLPSAEYHTVVLYDQTTRKITSFAQLNPAL